MRWPNVEDYCHHSSSYTYECPSFYFWTSWGAAVCRVCSQEMLYDTMMVERAGPKCNTSDDHVLLLKSHGTAGKRVKYATRPCKSVKWWRLFHEDYRMMLWFFAMVENRPYHSFSSRKNHRYQHRQDAVAFIHVICESTRKSGWSEVNFCLFLEKSEYISLNKLSASHLLSGFLSHQQYGLFLTFWIKARNSSRV